MRFSKLIILSIGIFMSLDNLVKAESILATPKPPSGSGEELPPPPSVITSIDIEKETKTIKAIDLYRQVTNMGVYEQRWQESLPKTTRLYRFTSE